MSEEIVRVVADKVDNEKIFYRYHLWFNEGGKPNANSQIQFGISLKSDAMEDLPNQFRIVTPHDVIGLGRPTYFLLDARKASQKYSEENGEDDILEIAADRVDKEKVYYRYYSAYNKDGTPRASATERDGSFLKTTAREGPPGRFRIVTPTDVKGMGRPAYFVVIDEKASQEHNSDDDDDEDDILEIAADRVDKEKVYYRYNSSYSKDGTPRASAKERDGSFLKTAATEGPPGRFRIVTPTDVKGLGRPAYFVIIDEKPSQKHSSDDDDDEDDILEIVADKVDDGKVFYRYFSAYNKDGKPRASAKERDGSFLKTAATEGPPGRFRIVTPTDVKGMGRPAYFVVVINEKNVPGTQQ